MTVFRWRHLYLRALSAHGYDEHAQLENSYRTFLYFSKDNIDLPAFLLLLQTSLFL